MTKIYKDEPCPECGNFTNRGVSIDVVIIKDDKVLLIKRGTEPFENYWAFPGGYVGWDETVTDAVKREAKEETNLVVQTMKLVGVYSKPERHPKQVINVAYLVGVEVGEPQNGDDAKEVRWFSLADLPNKLAFDHKQILADALNSL